MPVAGPVDASLCAAAHAADLRCPGPAHASEGVVEEDVDLVLLVDERVVVESLDALIVPLAGVVVVGVVAADSALLAPEVRDACVGPRSCTSCVRLAARSSAHGGHVSVKSWL